jgi:hypothetical protein
MVPHPQEKNMTSMVSRDDLENELYKIAGPHRAAQLPRLMQIIDKYAITVSRKMGDLSVDWAPDQYRYLKPGDTDEETGKRRCAGCGKVKTLKEYATDRRYPNGRRRRCLECSPDKKLVREYWCPGCKERLSLDKFGVKKKRNPSRVFKCLVCEQKKAS